MTRRYFPGCGVKERNPQASAWLAEQVIERGYADEVVGCCRVNHQKLEPGDVAVCICNTCMAFVDEDAPGADVESVLALVDTDPGFPLPDYTGRAMGIQDCGRAYDRVDVQDAVRSLMRKMGIQVVELPDAREESRFCGSSFLKEVPAQDAGFAPKRFVEDACVRSIFVPHEPAQIDAALREHAGAIGVDEVCCYCFACEMGLEAGGKDAVHNIELLSGRFRDR